jgi:4-hydroxy-tetrahydrodipicolinate reductase
MRGGLKLKTKGDTITMLKLAITGCTGRMGRMVLKEVNQNPEVEIVGAITRPGNPFVGQDIGPLIGEAPLNIMISDKPEFGFSLAQVIIDFSKPEGLDSHLKAALYEPTPYVVCMTGLSNTQKAFLEEASKTLPILIAPNTSLGIAVLRMLSLAAAKILGPSYDISILEMHHRNKADAPSGTSLSIAHTLTSLDRLSNNKAPYPSQSPRPDNTIECAVLRGGGIPADLDVSFAGENELLKIEHRALDRTLFAQGAIKAAEWLVDKPAGLYSMDDVVGLDE